MDRSADPNLALNELDVEGRGLLKISSVLAVFKRVVARRSTLWFQYQVKLGRTLSTKSV